MIKKYKRETDLKIFTPAERLEGPLFAYGKVGSGKSVSLLSLAQGYHDEFNYAIWDIFGGSRNESEFWALPSDETNYWSRLRMLGQLDEAGPKQYEVLFMYPCFLSKMPKRLPKKSPYVTSKVFTIPLKDVITEDIEMVTGQLSETAKFIWNEMIHNASKKDNSGNLLRLSESQEAESSILYKNFILPVSRENFLMDKYADTNLDLKEEARNKKRIKVLCLRFVPKEFRLFVINYIMRKLVELLDESAIPKRNILIVREASLFFRATDNSILPEKLKLFRHHFAEYIKEGRRGMYFFLDCQSSYETKGIVQGQEDYLIMFRLTSWRDKADICEELKRERRMRADQVADLARLDKGEAYVAESGRNVKKIKFSMPRTMFWKKEHGDFYKNAWESFSGEWSNTEEVIEYIKERCRIEKKEKTPIEPEQIIKQPFGGNIFQVELQEKPQVKKEISVFDIMRSAYNK